MKGVILKCLEKMVIEHHGGKETWKQILEKAHMPAKPVMNADDLDDAQVMQVIDATCAVLSITRQQAYDAFGEYWSTTFAPSIYNVYFNKYKSARELLSGLDSIHVAITKAMDNARPPRFEYQESPDSLTMIYQSPRGLADLVVPLARGILTYYGEKGSVSKLDETHIKIVFSN